MNMIAVTEPNGYRVIYGDTDSIFAWIKGDNEHECMVGASSLKQAIQESLTGTPFETIGADIKGNYRLIVNSNYVQI